MIHTYVYMYVYIWNQKFWNTICPFTTYNECWHFSILSFLFSFLNVLHDLLDWFTTSLGHSQHFANYCCKLLYLFCEEELNCWCISQGQPKKHRQQKIHFKRFTTRNWFMHMWSLWVWRSEICRAGSEDGRLEVSSTSWSCCHRQNFFYLQETSALLFKSFNWFNHAHPDYLG